MQPTHCLLPVQCLQVVEGINYFVTVSVTCKDEDLAWGNGIETVSLAAVVYTPVPTSSGDVHAPRMELLGHVITGPALPRPPEPVAMP